MPIYVCDKCDYNTTKKHHMKQHLDKINPCSKEIIIVNQDTFEDCELEQIRNRIRRLKKNELND